MYQPQRVVIAIVLTGIVGAVLSAMSCSTPDTPAVHELAPFRVIAVRHAEKVSSAPDSELSETGNRRAEDLAHFLSDVPLSRIYSSDFRRTLDTAKPLQTLRDLDVELYDPRSLETLVSTLESRREDALVVGHSNTTPQLVRLLGGSMHDAEKTLPEELDESEYDRLYVLRIGPDSVETTLYHLSPFDRR